MKFCTIECIVRKKMTLRLALLSAIMAVSASFQGQSGPVVPFAFHNYFRV